MATELERKGNALFVDEDYDAALECYTQGVEMDPGNASLYASRAAAHLKLENFLDAIVDANKAIEIDPSISKAYLRKGMACFSLEEFQTAKATFEQGLKLDPKNSQYKTWIRKCDVELADENEPSEPAPAVTSSVPTPTTSSQPAKESPSVSPKTEVKDEETAEAPEPSPPQVSQPPLPPPKYRHEFYQTATQVTVTVFAKKIKAEELKVEIGVQTLSVKIDTGDGDPYSLQLRLYGKVVPEKSRHILMGTKIEIKLEKAESIQWTGLDYAARKLDQPVNVSNETAAVSARVFPSSRKRPEPMDWDKLEASIKAEEKDEKLEGDAGLNKLFQQIYANADEDMRRAMNKSYVESGGTTLSTDWKDVGSKFIAPHGSSKDK
ncbi:SGT1B homolog [Klebsormidium nitens]|uniref:SGT1B homolog n=1 Tax=Klebsormidium nitens TaxID=105231 RepID=A0A1Y1HXL9_KLENI|nr:SGT1B homolog [Klebsormidium nitens]|eukprot:GAQ83404.1 SGT1B homolog [Klebsormidium nitens]